MIARTRMRYGMVGAGRIAKAYARAFQATELAELVAVSDVRKESADAIAESMDCLSFTSHEDMAEAADLDAVVICTPPSTHPGITTDLMARKLHVLCEKPLAIDSGSARRMFAYADQHGVRFSMASRFRHATDIIAAKSLVSSGVLGDVILLENVFTGRIDMSQRWHSNPAISGGGVLIGHGTHSVDIMRYFLGDVADLKATGCR